MSNMNDGFKVPNMSKPRIPQSSEIGILNKLNESQANRQKGTQPMHEAASTTASCPVCGVTWTPDVTMEDGAGQVCPACGSPLTDPNQAGLQDSAVENEQETDKIEQAKLESTLQEYVGLLDAGQLNEAKQLLESAGASAVFESVDGANTILLEKFVIKVDSSGHKTKKKVRTKKVKRTAAQKAALRKARKTANKGMAKKKRKKAMKARARMGLNESIRKTQICNAVHGLLESRGLSINAKLVEKAISEAYHMNEAEVELPEEKVLSTLETIFNNHGLTVTDSETEIVEGVMVAHVSVQDNDSEVYLGDIADEVEETLEGYSVDYDEPEEDPEDGVTDIDFYFVPDIGVNECSAPGDPTVDPKKDAAKNESTDPEVDPEDPEKKPENENCNGKKGMNEGIENSPRLALFESFAGGTDNVRCKMNPAFIKPNQLIFDAEEQTVFKALTESVATDGGYKLAIEVCNSANSKLSDLAAGAEVTLSSAGDYFLLRNNPLV